MSRSEKNYTKFCQLSEKSGIQQILRSNILYDRKHDRIL